MTSENTFEGDVLNSEAEEFVTLEVLENSLYIHDQIGEYQDRGEMLEQFSYLDFFLQTYDKAMPTHEEGCRGRPQSVKIPYHQHSIHQNQCRILHGEQAEVIPNFPGKWFANRENLPDHPLYCASLLALLKPWRSLADLKSVSETFVDAFEHFLVDSSLHKVLEEDVKLLKTCTWRVIFSILKVIWRMTLMKKIWCHKVQLKQ
ncbi:uncharacterized protein F5147DRAFT_653173 [Suillus discolor]|uniref:Uncharacterized protein n=1 Tax=Suillus discolor TaxID=1912936 RepID=A0A9P7F567_9AGAM|nr:uncharacterized protein F5147DRAFT_653173 [Suillus discolor]KAG2107640.1 hypothetical protein F5147DRAFT_653173 [Suillus discolor]